MARSPPPEPLRYTLPLLPCTDNPYYVIFESHDVVADCVDTARAIPVTGTFAMASGPDRDVFAFGLSSNPLPNRPRLGSRYAERTVKDNGHRAFLSGGRSGDVPGGESVCVPAGGGVKWRYVWAGDDQHCDGLSPIEVRTVITLDNTVLTGLNADGTGDEARRCRCAVRYLPFAMARWALIRQTYRVIRAQTRSPSRSLSGELQLLPAAERSDGFGFYRSVADFCNGRSQISFTNDMFSDTMGITFDSTTGAVLEAWVQISSSFGVPLHDRLRGHHDFPA